MSALSTTFRYAAKSLGFGLSNPIKTTIGATVAADVATGQGLGSTAGAAVPGVLNLGADMAGNFMDGALGNTNEDNSPPVPGALNLRNEFESNANPLAAMMQNFGSAFGNNPGAMLGAAMGFMSGGSMMSRMINAVIGGVLGAVITKFAGPMIGNLMNNDGPQASGASGQFNPASFGLPSTPAPATVAADVNVLEQNQRPAPAAAPSLSPTG